MQDRIEELIITFDLKPHPEGGYFAETYRSEQTVLTANGERNLITSIYFLLTSNDVSKFHVIESDELWFHHEGCDVNIHVLSDGKHEILKLGRTGDDAYPQQLVEKRKIFGSTLEDTGSYALVSCVVAPGFDFSDFRLCHKEELKQQFPEYSEIIERLGH